MGGMEPNCVDVGGFNREPLGLNIKYAEIQTMNPRGRKPNTKNS